MKDAQHRSVPDYYLLHFIPEHFENTLVIFILGQALACLTLELTVAEMAER